MVERNSYEDMYQFIRTQLISKYLCLKGCTMHILPEVVDYDVEFIFRIDFRTTADEINNLKRDILNELIIEFNLDYYSSHKIFLIFHY